MPSSLILQGGAASAKSLKEVIVHPTTHSFTKGDVVRWDTNTNRYVLAQADSADRAEVVGIVTDILSTTSFELTVSGFISGISAAPAGVSAPVMFLSAANAGRLETSPPSAIGTVVKPVLTRNTSGDGYLMMNYLGTQIGGSSTVAVDEIQPVGTIMPFAGTAIPDTWLECNGGSYLISDYPQLYERVRNTTGVRAPVYGHVFTVTTNAVVYATNQSATTLADAVNSGTAVFLRDRAATLTQNIVARIISVSGSGNSLTITAQIIPTYNRTTKNFVVPNSFIKVGGTITSFTDPGGIEGIGVMGSNGIVEGTYVNGAVINSLTVTHFNVPDLRGRFALGMNTGSISDIDGDPTFISSLSTYGMGSLGGEERHILTTEEIAAHAHQVVIPEHDHFLLGIGGGNQRTFFGPGNYGGSTPQNSNDVLRAIGNGQGDNVNFEYSLTSGGSQTQTVRSGKTFKSDQVTINSQSLGSNTPHNNMPPYVAVRYIIKAKPYTRAAIIDGVDLPYSNFLVRELRTQSILGGSDTNMDLGIYTNTQGDGGNGTLRVTVLGSNGNVGIGKASPQTLLDVNGTGAFTGIAVGKTSLASGVALDVIGHARSSIALSDFSAAANSTLTTKEYVLQYSRNISTNTIWGGTVTNWVGTLSTAGGLISEFTSYTPPGGSAITTPNWRVSTTITPKRTGSKILLRCYAFMYSDTSGSAHYASAQISNGSANVLLENSSGNTNTTYAVWQFSGSGQNPGIAGHPVLEGIDGTTNTVAGVAIPYTFVVLCNRSARVYTMRIVAEEI